MAKAKAIDKRRKSVRNTRKITRTMEMISTAAFKKAGGRTKNFRPYADSIHRLIGNVGRAAGDVSHPLLEAPQRSAPEAVLLITSNRGLCASYNTNVNRITLKYLKEIGADTARLYLSGKKGFLFFKKNEDVTIAERYTHINYIPAWSDVDEIADMFLDMFEKQEIRGLSVVYTQFKSAGTQVATREVLLPIAESGVDDEEQPAATVDYIFHPEPQEILEELIPLSFKVKLFSCFLESGTSEQIARMRAMHSATDAADKMIKYLTQKYNRARQTQVTMELLDIIGGAMVVT